MDRMDTNDVTKKETKFQCSKPKITGLLEWEDFEKQFCTDCTNQNAFNACLCSIKLKK